MRANESTCAGISHRAVVPILGAFGMPQAVTRAALMTAAGFTSFLGVVVTAVVPLVLLAGSLVVLVPQPDDDAYDNETTKPTGQATDQGRSL